MSGKNTQSDYELLYPEDTNFTGTAYDVFIEHRYGNWEDDDSWWEPGEAICVDGRYPVFATYEDAARYASTLTPAVLGDIFSEEGEELTTLTVVLEECHFTDGEMRDGDYLWEIRYDREDCERGYSDFSVSIPLNSIYDAMRRDGIEVA